MSHHSAAPVVEEMTRYMVMESLRQTGIELNRMWSRSVQAGNDDAIQYAEASQAVYRALVVLRAH